MVEADDAAHSLIGKLLDGAPDAMAVVDAQGHIILFNLQAEQLFGYTRAELLGSSVEVLIPERFKQAHIGHRAQFLHAPQVRPMGTGRELFGRRRDGSEFPIEISLSPVQTAHELLTAASIRDISDRKRQDQEMRFVQQQLLSAVESIQGAFAIFDAQDKLVLCNSNFRSLIGRGVVGKLEQRSSAELIEHSISAGVFQLGEHSTEHFIERWRNYHRAPEGALAVATPDGRSLRLVERPTMGGGWVTHIWDVTADVELAEQLRNAHALAKAASEAKSEFLASMSHELRTPLNAILGFAQLLQRDRKTPLSERQQERIGHVLTGGEHLLRLIDEVLDLARVEAGRISVSLEPVAIAPVLDEIQHTLDAMATRHAIHVQVEALPHDLPAVLADRTRLKQILMNYGSNAIKYGRMGGHVQIAASAQELSVRITVRDDGIGIPLDKQDKMFHPFHRAGQEAGLIEGTGIGLAISKRLAQLMHGNVGFESAVGSGSSFWIDLPTPAQPSLPLMAATPAAEHPSGLSGAEGPRFTIVYVEDNPSNIALLADFVADYERIELITAPNAEVGIALIREHLPDVVLMDLNLPGMNGLEATKQLRAAPETAHIPIIGLSAAAMMRDALRVVDAGFYRYLTKPVHVDELARTLEALFAARSGVESTIS